MLIKQNECTILRRTSLRVTEANQNIGSLSFNDDDSFNMSTHLNVICGCVGSPYGPNVHYIQHTDLNSQQSKARSSDERRTNGRTKGFPSLQKVIFPSDSFPSLCSTINQGQLQEWMEHSYTDL